MNDSKGEPRVETVTPEKSNENGKLKFEQELDERIHNGLSDIDEETGDSVVRRPDPGRGV